MKRIFLALFLLSWTLGAASQNVALGEKTPDLKVKSWLDDRMPVPGRAFLLVFFHSTSRPAVESLAHLQELGRKFGDRVNVVVVVRESPEAVGGIVRPYAEGNLTVAFDDSGRSFAAYDVQYLPFGVLVSAKGRALWMGNPRQLTEAILDSNL